MLHLYGFETTKKNKQDRIETFAILENYFPKIEHVVKNT